MAEEVLSPTIEKNTTTKLVLHTTSNMESFF